jgi:hypothetical protein
MVFAKLVMTNHLSSSPTITQVSDKPQINVEKVLGVNVGVTKDVWYAKKPTVYRARVRSQEASSFPNNQLAALDFGKMATGTSSDLRRVISIRNLINQYIGLTVRFDGTIAPFIGSAYLSQGTGKERFSVVNFPLERERGVWLNLSLDIPIGTKPGTYSGTMILESMGGFLQRSVPLEIDIIPSKE